MLYANGNKPQTEQTASPDKYPQGSFKNKKCRGCGNTFTPLAPSHLYCSQKCADRAYTSRYLRRTYKITLEDYERLLKSQNGRCAICGGEGFLMDASRHKVKLVVDHDHKSGRIRGLLCHNCNRALGLLHDDSTALQTALEYLKVQRPS